MKNVFVKWRNYLVNKRLNSWFIHIFMAILSFALPLSLAIMLFRANNYYPFVNDGQTLMMVDMSGQYIAFFRYYKSLFNDDVNIMYTLSKATGGEFLSIFLYYLASPFNIIIMFFPLIELPKVLMWIVVLKIATAGLTSYIALTKTNKNGYKNILFSVSYALISYSFVYFSNIMWLDGIYLLPLIALGIYKITKGKSPLLYILSLSLMIIASWYIAIMVAIFSVLFFIVQFNHNFVSWKKGKWQILFFVSGSLIAGLISVAFWVTAFLTILGTKGSSSITDLGKTIAYFNDFISIQKGFFANSFSGFIDISGSATTVSFYVGIIPAVLTILFFFKKDVKFRQKVGVLLLFAIYIFAFNNAGINDLFHGGPRPNWFPGRYAFIVGFLLIFYAAQSLDNFKNVAYWGLFVPPFVSIGLFFFVKNDRFVFNDSAYLYFILLYLILVFYYAFVKNVAQHRKTTESRGLNLLTKVTSPLIFTALTFVAILNVYGNNQHILASYTGENSRHKNYDVYMRDEKLADVVNYIQNQDQSLYRLEKSFLREGTYNNADNDSLYYGYNGISHYSSNEKKSTLTYLKKLGFHYNGFNLNYANGSTLAINSYLGVKYMIDNGQNNNFDLNRYLDKIEIPESEYIVTQNKYALPFLMAATKQNQSFVGDGYYVNENEVYWYDHFEYQNNLFKKLTDTVVDENGKQKDIFKRVDVTRTFVGLDALDADNHYKVNNNGQAVYRFDLNEDVNYYYYFTAVSKEHEDAPTVALYENSRRVTYFSYHGHQINGIKNNKASAKLEININGSSSNFEIKDEIYYEDLTVLAEYIDAIKNTALVKEMKQVDTAKYKANLTTFQDEQQIILTIPYDESLKVYLNGKIIESVPRFNIYTGFIIPQAGKHTLEIKYLQLSYQIGLPVGIFIFGATIFAHFKLKVFFKKDEENDDNS